MGRILAVVAVSSPFGRNRYCVIFVGKMTAGAMMPLLFARCKILLCLLACTNVVHGEIRKFNMLLEPAVRSNCFILRTAFQLKDQVRAGEEMFGHFPQTCSLTFLFSVFVHKLCRRISSSSWGDRFVPTSVSHRRGLDCGGSR
jgi:hypothetical protein